MDAQKGNWVIPTSVKFGAGRIAELAKTSGHENAPSGHRSRPR